MPSILTAKSLLLLPASRLKSDSLNTSSKKRPKYASSVTATIFIPLSAISTKPSLNLTASSFVNV